MPAPDAKIEKTSIGDNWQFNARSMRDTRTANQAMYGPDYVDPISFRPPELFVFIYSVVDPRPEGAHLFRSFPPLIPNLEIAELQPGERYAVVAKFPHPLNQMCMRENGERYIDSHNALRMAMDIVNPDNPTLDQDFKVNPKNVFSQGNDYGRLGVFWSKFPTPTDEEIDAAIRRKEKYYRTRLQDARRLEMTSPKELYNYLSVVDHIACDYFGVETSWHQNFATKLRGEKKLDAD